MPNPVSFFSASRPIFRAPQLTGSVPSHDTCDQRHAPGAWNRPGPPKARKGPRMAWEVGYHGKADETGQLLTNFSDFACWGIDQLEVDFLLSQPQFFLNSCGI